MSNLEHPPIEFDANGPSLERLFAEEIYQTLSLTAVLETDRIDDIWHTFLVTEGYDLSAKNLGQVALRLKGMITMSKDRGDNSNSVHVSDDYFVTELQYRHTEEYYDQGVIDDEAPWQSYIVVIVNRNDIDDIDILDSRNGKQLDLDDMVQALFVLKALRDEIRASEFEEDIPKVDYSIDSNLNGHVYDDFEPADFLEDARVPATSKTPPQFNPYSQN